MTHKNYCGMPFNNINLELPHSANMCCVMYEGFEGEEGVEGEDTGEAKEESGSGEGEKNKSEDQKKKS